MDSVRDAAGAVDVEKVAAGTVGEVGMAAEADVGAGVYDGIGWAVRPVSAAS